MPKRTKSTPTVARWHITQMWAVGQSDNYYDVVNPEVRGGFVSFTYGGQPYLISGNIRIKPMTRATR